MNDEIFLEILKAILNASKSNNDCNNMENVIEEYIDWLIFSENKRKLNYKRYKDMLQQIQCYYLLREPSEAICCINRTIELIRKNLL